jgi:hypothetical protein
VDSEKILTCDNTKIAAVGMKATKIMEKFLNKLVEFAKRIYLCYRKVVTESEAIHLRFGSLI